jgi:hypothetical protein
MGEEQFIVQKVRGPHKSSLARIKLHMMQDVLKLQHKLQWVLNGLLQLLHELATNCAVNNLVVEAAGDDNLVVPLDSRQTVL